MPILNFDYRPPAGFSNPHLQTVFPKLRRKVREVVYRRERFELSDGDFMDFDWYAEGQPRVVILCHGLESSSNETCMRGLAQALGRGGYTVLALNFRGCSGESNRLLRSYHAGASEDLCTVVNELRERKHWDAICLVGVSLGGNVVLKYLSELGATAREIIRAAATVSVPCDLKGSAHVLSRPGNFMYLKIFMDSLKAKLQAKIRQWPRELGAEARGPVRNLVDFDNVYTAPVHGFADAEDYYRRCSSATMLSELQIPTLMIQAVDDPFLTEACHPRTAAEANPHLYLLNPKQGGHVGFIRFDANGEYWHETQVVNFLERWTE